MTDQYKFRYLWMLGVADIVQVLSPVWARALRERYRVLRGGKK